MLYELKNDVITNCNFHSNDLKKNIYIYIIIGLNNYSYRNIYILTITVDI